MHAILTDYNALFTDNKMSAITLTENNYKACWVFLGQRSTVFRILHPSFSQITATSLSKQLTVRINVNYCEIQSLKVKFKLRVSNVTIFFIVCISRVLEIFS